MNFVAFVNVVHSTTTLMSGSLRHPVEAIARNSPTPLHEEMKKLFNGMGASYCIQSTVCSSSQGYWPPKSNKSCEPNDCQRFRPSKAAPRIEKVASSWKVGLRFNRTSS